MVILEVNEVAKNFGGVRALWNISLKIEGERIYGLIGPNGSGKSTLFKVIMGIIKPDAGKITFKGENITGLAPHKICRKGVACTFQLVRVFPNLTVYDNVRVGVVGSSRILTEKIAVKVNELLNFVDLSEKKNVLAMNLTLAEQRRLDLARALATSPQLLLLDELMAGLNPTEVANTLKLIKEINKNGICIIMIEHVMKAIMNVSEWIFVLNMGEKIAEGKPAEVVQNEEVVKAYLGEKWEG